MHRPYSLNRSLYQNNQAPHDQLSHLFSSRTLPSFLDHSSSTLDGALTEVHLFPSLAPLIPPALLLFVLYSAQQKKQAHP